MNDKQKQFLIKQAQSLKNLRELVVLNLLTNEELVKNCKIQIEERLTLLLDYILAI